MKRAKRARATNSGPLVTLTENQRQILLQMFAGSRVGEIAAATGRRPSTIANTIHGIRKQMGARTDVDLLRECLCRRLVTLREIFTLTDALRRAHEPAADDGARGRATNEREPDR